MTSNYTYFRGEQYVVNEINGEVLRSSVQHREGRCRRKIAIKGEGERKSTESGPRGS